MKYEVPLETLMGENIKEVRETKKGFLIVLDTGKRFLLGFPKKNSRVRGLEFLKGKVLSVETSTRHSKGEVWMTHCFTTESGRFSVRFLLETWKADRKNGLFWIPRKAICSCDGLEVVSVSEFFGEVVFRMETPTRREMKLSYSGNIHELFELLEERGFVPTAEERVHLVREIQKKETGTGHLADIIKKCEVRKIPLDELMGRKICWINRTENGLFLYDFEDNLFLLSGEVFCPESVFFRDAPLFPLDKEQKTWKIGHIEIELSGIDGLFLVMRKPLVLAMEGRKPGACRVVYPGNKGEDIIPIPRMDSRKNLIFGTITRDLYVTKEEKKKIERQIREREKTSERTEG